MSRLALADRLREWDELVALGRLTRERGASEAIGHPRAGSELGAAVLMSARAAAVREIEHIASIHACTAATTTISAVGRVPILSATRRQRNAGAEGEHKESHLYPHQRSLKELSAQGMRQGIQQYVMAPCGVSEPVGLPPIGSQLPGW